MPPILFKVTRVLLAIILLIFGSNKMLHFLPMNIEAIPTAALDFTSSLKNTYALYLISILEILAAIAFLTNRYGALMALILMSISINAFLYHLFLLPQGLALSIVFLVFNIVILIGYKERYTELLKA
ncbi:hypothetical protein GCM10011414_27130 [Croceivirga lutea]|uniref:DoxX family protein n=1 Tax=Croceivirga lutea TaxID=1775167 RepID=UPI00163B3B25|nr:DoxX family protein [Croceivirga lutea]GGG55863.1 hypothetical protein GCM10011414_27130 [Croceivirga lutea]